MVLSVIFVLCLLSIPSVIYYFGLCLIVIFFFVSVLDSVGYLVFFFFSSRRRHTRCALVTGVQTCALPISAAADAVAVDVIDYDDKGEVVFSGRADPGARVEVFIDDEKVGDTGADAEGRWTMRPEAPVAPGSYQLRVDNVAAGGTGEARVAFPFLRADPPTDLPGNRLVVIQPGNNLSRIPTRVSGSGVR